jgi:predicted nucleic acid-binding Zn ribbon protein
MDPIGSVVPFAVRRLLRQGEMSQGKLEFAWRSAVGPAIERATHVRLDESGTLEVLADDAAWRKELRRSQTTILNRLKELLGPTEVKALRIVGHGTRS